jgi:hypothetical protein
MYGHPSSGESGANSISWIMVGADRVFREDRLGPFEGLVDRRFRRHPVLHYIEFGDAEDVLRIDLGDRRVVGLVDRQGRTEERLLSVDGAMRVLLEPERVALGDLWYRDRKTAKPAFQIL